MGFVQSRLKSRVGLVLGSFIAPMGLVVAVLRPRAFRGEGIPSPDFYGYSLPMVQQIQRAWQSGHGLLWNDLLNSGQPLLAIPSSEAWYPPTLLLAHLGPFAWAQVWIVLHLALAGGASFALARTLGQSNTAACATGLAVQLGGMAPFFGLWFPIVLATYAWTPVVLLACERLIRRPRPAAACALAAALTFQLVAGYPQIVVFTCGLVVMRIAWESSTRREWRQPSRLALAAAGLLLPLLLAAVYVLPAAEVMAESVRTAPMTSGDIDPRGRGLESWRAKVDARRSAGGFFPLAMVLAGAAIGRTGSRRIAIFYGLAAVSFLMLIPDSPLRDAFRSLPLIGRLRGSDRFAWIASLCVCWMVGQGIDAFSNARSVRERGSTLAGAVTGAIAFQLLAPSGWLARELWTACLALALAGLAWSTPKLRRVALAGLLAALATDLWPAVTQPPLRLLTDIEVMRPGSDAFAFLSNRVTAQERVLVWPAQRWLGRPMGVAEKTPAVHGIASISDYEHTASRRYATVYTYMTTGRYLETVGDWIRALGSPPRHRPLLDLLAARYLITDHAAVWPAGAFRPIWSDREVRVLENPTALPRAFFVPRGRVVRGGRETLALLASREHDPRRIVLLSHAPEDGFLGNPETADAEAGIVVIEAARGEAIDLALDVPVAGFLVLTDAFFPGWTANVDDRPVPILRANHAFRAVRVPAGPSRVSFRYASRSLRWGALVSASTFIALAWWVAGGAGRTRAALRSRT
jgi:hypothetical protein